jgi:excisionase family DNA binding protein
VIDAAAGAVLLTIDEVARALHISARMVEGLIASGRMSSLKVGRLRRIPRAAVIDFIETTIAAQAEDDDEQLPVEALRLVRRASRTG